MRLAYQDSEFVYDDDDVLAGICLGYDFCAEHEWGVKDMRKHLGVWDGDPKTEKRVFGFARNRINDPSRIVEFEHETKYIKSGNKRPSMGTVYAVGLKAPNWREDNDLGYLKQFIDGNTYEFRKDFNAAWCERDFLVWLPADSPKRADLERIYRAFKNKEMLIGMHRPNNPFSGSGLFFGIESSYTVEDEKSVIADQKAYREMWERVNKTKIFEKLKKADCRFFACSPKIQIFKSVIGDEDREVKITERQKSSKLPDVMFWLNPMEQRKNNFGWFTVEELEQWTEGLGPIPMKG